MALSVFEILMAFQSVASAFRCESLKDFRKTVWKDFMLHADLFDPDGAFL